MSRLASHSGVSARTRWLTVSLLLVLSTALGGAAVVTYNYDAAGRLVSVAYDDGSTVSYTLDAAGNRTIVAAVPPTPISVPGSFAAVPQSSTQIKLSWAPSSGGSGVTGYNVYRGGTLLTPSGTTNLSYTDSGLTANTPYTNYTAIAYDSEGNNSPPTAAASATTCALPTISSFTAATASSSQLNLSASAADSCGQGLQSYQIYRYPANQQCTGSSSLIKTITPASSTLSYPDTGLASSSTYCYALYALDTGGGSGSATAQGGTYPLPSISSFSGSGASPTSISLTWAANDSGGPNGGALTYSVTNTTLGRAVPNCTSITAISCTDSSLANGTSYAYQLTASDSTSDTATATASAWTAPGAPGTPTFTSITSGSATMGWSPAQGTVSSYSYSVSGGTPWTSVTSTPTSVSLAGLSPGTNYPSVTLYASNTGGNSPTSSAPLLTTPGQPGIPSFSAITQTSATINWGPAAGTVISSYSYRLNTQSTPTNVGTNLTASVSGLSPGTTYTVFVYASNASGNSTQSSNAFTTLAPPGTFQWSSGQHSGPIGSLGDVATAFVKNTGGTTITGISYSCSGGSWVDYGGPTSLAPGVTAGFECQSTGYSYSVQFTLSGTNASNSPFTTPSF